MTAYRRGDDRRFGPPPFDNRTMPAAVVIPQLTYDDVAEAVRWLCDTFGFSVRWQAVITARSSKSPAAAAWWSPSRGPRMPSAAWSVMVRVADVDAHYEHAVSRGATILAPPEDFPYGERQYVAEDLAGHHWDFTQSIADVAPETCPA